MSFCVLGANLLAQNRPPAVNFIDEEIQARWEDSAASAPLTTDLQFLRRVSLDLIGRVPSPDEIRAFAANKDPRKREILIDKLLASPWFIDKWTQWFGELVHQSHNAIRGYSGRNAFYGWIHNGIEQHKSLPELVFGVIDGTGNNFDVVSGGANFVLYSLENAPNQDHYDLAASRATASFLGMGHYDCLMCHGGRGHLNGISLWGERATRLDAWRMSAFFCRIAVNRINTPEQYFDSNMVTDVPSGQYYLNTDFGNRPPRTPIGDVRAVDPVYRTGEVPENGNFRAEFARFLAQDRMFARNFANRFWKEMMGRGLVEPVDGLDPDRLDPANPPPDPWPLQASHPVLLERLADFLKEANFDMRAFLRLLARSSTYQLSSQMDGAWSDSQELLYLRHHARRLTAEEVHDAVVKTTGKLPAYRLRVSMAYSPSRLSWAHQFPGPMSLDEIDPVSNDFYKSFYPGDRNSLPRSLAGSILQELALLNSPFVTGRLAELTNLKRPEDIADELYLLFLSRYPSLAEKQVAVDYLKKTRDRTAAIEDLAWTCLNNVEFLVNP